MRFSNHIDRNNWSQYYLTSADIVRSLFRFRRPVRGVFGGVPCSKSLNEDVERKACYAEKPEAKSSASVRSDVNRLRAEGGVKTNSMLDDVDEIDYQYK